MVRDDDRPFRRDRGILFLAAGLLLSGAALAQADTASGDTGDAVIPPAKEAVPAAAGERSDVPTPRSVEEPWMSLAEWRRRHAAQRHAEGRAQAEVVFLGDSITEGWGQSAAFHERFGHYHPLNLGIGGDQTQHVLWRIEDGTLDGLTPRLLVLLIGVNNLGNGQQSPEQTARGVAAILRAVRARRPHTPVLLLAILPAGQRSDDPLRQEIALTNPLLEKLAEPGSVSVLDVGASFLEKDGTISADVMQDFLHPNASGYATLTEAVAPAVERLLTQR